MYCFLVAYITGLRYSYNRKKGLIGSKLRTLIIADEARILFNANRDAKVFGESYLCEIITKSRDIGLAYFALSQETGSFTQTMRSVSYLKVAFPLQDGKDLTYVKESFFLDDDQTKFILKLKAYGQAIVRYGAYPDPFLLQVPYFKIKKQITDEEIEIRMSDFYNKLNDEMRETQRFKLLEIRPAIPPDASSLLYFLSKAPFAKTSEMAMAPGFTSPEEVSKALNWLEENDFVKREAYRVSSKGRKAVFAVLLEKAKAYLGILGTTKGKGGFEHSLYQNLILKSLIQQNIAGKIEGKMRNSNKPIDVLSYSKDTGFVAYEITLHFENLIDNIQQDFAGRVTKVVIVTRDKDDLEKAKKMVEEDRNLDQYSEKIFFVVIDHFFT